MTKVYPQYPPRYQKGTKKKKRQNKKQDDIGVLSLLAASLRHQTTEFFNNSTLHGVRYIAEKERPFCEKWVCNEKKILIITLISTKVSI